MKKILIFLMAALFYSSSAEETPVDQIRSMLQNMTPEQKDSFAAQLDATVERMKEQQIKTIGGIPFGIDKTIARIKLRNKFGQEFYTTNDNMICFENIKYAGNDFGSVHFLFVSDGTKSFLNSCIFVKKAKTKEEAFKLLNGLRLELEKKYSVISYTGDNGFPNYGGGISPLWDGYFAHFLPEYMPAWHIDVIEYNQEIIKEFGHKYGVRLIYGPYKYVNEEF